MSSATPCGRAWPPTRGTIRGRARVHTSVARRRQACWTSRPGRGGAASRIGDAGWRCPTTRTSWRRSAAPRSAAGRWPPTASSASWKRFWGVGCEPHPSVAQRRKGMRKNEDILELPGEIRSVKVGVEAVGGRKRCLSLVISSYCRAAAGTKEGRCWLMEDLRARVR